MSALMVLSSSSTLSSTCTSFEVCPSASVPFQHPGQPASWIFPHPGNGWEEQNLPPHSGLGSFKLELSTVGVRRTRRALPSSAPGPGSAEQASSPVLSLSALQFLVIIVILEVVVPSVVLVFFLLVNTQLLSHGKDREADRGLLPKAPPPHALP